MIWFLFGFDISWLRSCFCWIVIFDLEIEPESASYFKFWHELNISIVFLDDHFGDGKAQTYLVCIFNHLLVSKQFKKLILILFLNANAFVCNFKF